MIEAKDAAAAGCCVVSTIREYTLSTLVEWSAQTCLSISMILLGSLIFCHLNYIDKKRNKSTRLDKRSGTIYKSLSPKTYRSSVSFLTREGKGNVPAHGKSFANLRDLKGLGRNPQKGVALSKVTPFTSRGLHAAKYNATYPPSEFPTPSLQ